MPLLVYKSSAGSGKTFTLVKQYLKIVLQNPYDYKRILAITFTNKATDEMKQRILKELRLLVLGKSDMQADLITDLNQPLAYLQQQAEKALNNILHDYSRFEISTIDSFFSRIIRSFAKELQLPFRYDVELDTTHAINESINNLIQKVHKDESLRQWLLSFALSRLDNDKGWNIEHGIKTISKDIFKEEVFEWIKDAEPDFKRLNQLIKDCKNQIKIFEKNLAQYRKDTINFLNEKGLEKSDFKAYTLNWIFENRKAKLHEPPNNPIIKVLAGNTDWYTKTAAKKEQIQSIEDELNLLAGEAVAYYQDNIAQYNTYKIILQNIYAYGILSLINRELKLYRTENSLMLMADANFMLRETIGDNDAPFIYEKIGSFYKHIFIDEFQDTSNNQWHNLKPLVYNSLSGGHTVFIVGDVKQSIYRWRGGNLNLLLNQVENEFQPLFPQAFQNKFLKDNWRSRQQIVEFNNQFFQLARQILSAENPEIQSLTKAYESIYQNPQKAKGGYIEINFCKEPSTKEKRESNAPNWMEQALEKTQKTISKVQQKGYSLQDIMVLVLKNKDANEVAEYLENAGIPIISQNSLKVNNSLHIKCLIAALRILLNPHDALSKATLLYRYSQIRKQKITDFDQEIDEIKKGEHPFFTQLFSDDFIQNLKGRSLFELIEEICIRINFDTGSNPYIHFLLDQVLDLQNRGTLSINAFLSWWDENNASLYLSTPENIQAVTVLTIHKAKGLEKPIVICPFMLDNGKNSKLIWTNELPEQLENLGIFPVNYNEQLKNSLFNKAYEKEYENDLLDKLNVLYVAFTRPQSELYIFTKSLPKNTSEKFSYNQLIHKVILQSDWANDFNSENGSLIIGEPTTKTKPDKTDKTAYINPSKSNSYQSKIQLRDNTENYFKLFNNKAGKKVREGVQLHALLERISHKHQIGNCIHQMLNEGLITQHDVERLENKSNQLFNNPTFAYWFTDNWQVLAEREILHQGKTYKPDRVIYNKQQTIIIDYKKEQQSNQHKQQLNRYGQLLAQMQFPNISKYLVYTETLEIIAI